MKKINIIDLAEFEDMEETFKEDYPEKYEEVAAFYKENKKDYFLRERYPEEFSEEEIEKSLSLQLAKEGVKEPFRFRLNASEEIQGRIKRAIQNIQEIFFRSILPFQEPSFGSSEDERIFLFLKNDKFFIQIGNDTISLNEEVHETLLEDIKNSKTVSWTIVIREI